MQNILHEELLVFFKENILCDCGYNAPLQSIVVSYKNY